MIPYRDEANLLGLMRLAQSTDGGGQLTVYRIVNNNNNAAALACARCISPTTSALASIANKQTAPGDLVIGADGTPVAVDGFEKPLKKVDDNLNPNDPKS